MGREGNACRGPRLTELKTAATADRRVIRIGNPYVDYAPDSSKVEAARPSKTMSGICRAIGDGDGDSDDDDLLAEAN